MIIVSIVLIAFIGFILILRMVLKNDSDISVEMTNYFRSFKITKRK